MDDNHQLVHGPIRHQMGDTGPGLVVWQEEGVELAGEVLSLEDHVGLDDVPAHRE